jgi:hypothetical protein
VTSTSKNKTLLLITHQSPTILASWHPPSRNNINPHSHTFSIAPASAANAIGFLQVSLSKILGNIVVAFTLNMARLGFPMNANDLPTTESLR